MNGPQILLAALLALGGTALMPDGHAWADDTGPGRASRVEWVLPGRTSSPNADVKLGLPGQASSGPAKVEYVMPGRETESAYVMPGRASAGTPHMPGQASAGWEQPSSEPESARNDMEATVWPVALFPDPLLALVLSASTSPLEDLEWVHRVIDESKDPSLLAEEDVSLPLKALVYCPEVLAAMKRGPDRTEALGRAFDSMPAAVLQTVQQLRAAAQGFGNLTSDSSMRVEAAGPAIRLMPYDDRTLNIPSYDSDRIFYGGGVSLRYGPPVSLGNWAYLDIDWSRPAVVARWAWSGPPAPEEGAFGGYGGSKQVEAWRGRGESSRGAAAGGGADTGEGAFGYYGSADETDQASDRGARSRDVTGQ